MRMDHIDNKTNIYREITIPYKASGLGRAPHIVGRGRFVGLSHMWGSGAHMLGDQVGCIGKNKNEQIYI